MGVRKKQESSNLDRAAKKSSNVANPSPSVPDMPHMEPQGLDMLSRHLRKARIFLEYGAGGSSVMAFKTKSIKRIYSVESDFQFLQRVLKKLQIVDDSEDRYVPIYVDVGQTGAWGAPTDPASAHLWPNYINEPWVVMATRKEAPDLVLIDGRFRVASLFSTLLFARGGTTILFDDYENRNQYHVVEKYAPVVEMAGRMAKFIVPNRKPRGVVSELLRYCTNFS